MEKIAVLGAGMVGRTIAIDLSKDYDVTSFDIRLDNLIKLREKGSNITIGVLDLTDYKNYDEYFKDYNYVVSAVPGFMGFETLRTLIECGKNVCDISFFPEDPIRLDSLAKQKNVTVITDMGVAPGMSNLILGRYNEVMEIANFEFYVGGLPKNPIEPFKYKAPFSPYDVIEEYTRPARMQENGEIVVKSALSERVILKFDEIGELEGFNTDGLRTLLTTMKHIPNMKEKTLRYVGHLDFIVNLRDAGFFSNENMLVNGTSKEIKPIDITSELLINQWKYEENEEDITIMKVIVDGKIKGKEISIEYDLFDSYDDETKLSSMSRSTGYVCSAGINLIITKQFTEKGVFPPELVGKNIDCFKYVMQYLEDNGIIWKFKAY